MKILSIDTSLTVATVSVIEDNNVLGSFNVNVKNKHSETLMPIIKNLLEITKVNPKEIEKVICGVGPGSFTGLRMGVATAKAFAYSNNINVIPVSTLDTLATNIKYTDKLIVSIIDGKRSNVYACSYKIKNNKLKRVSSMTFTNIDELLEKITKDNVEAIFVGDGALVYKELIEKNKKFCIANANDLLTNSTNMAFFAMENLIDEEVSAMDLKPMYLRKSQAERDYILNNINTLELIELNDTHIDEVAEIEKNTFPMPWSKDAFQKELDNKTAKYFVASFEGQVVGYGGVWNVSNEGFITNIAVREEFKKLGIGKKIVTKLIDYIKQDNGIGISLEVRVSNAIAIDLYKKLGFEIEGTRKNFYSDNNEDAYVMWNHF